MQSEEIRYKNAKGEAIKYLQDGLFDFKAFKSFWFANQVKLKLSDIASRHLNIKNLEEHPDLMLALLETYKFGNSSSRKNK